MTTQLMTAGQRPDLPSRWVGAPTIQTAFPRTASQLGPVGRRAAHLLKLLTPMVSRIGERQEQTVWTKLKRLLEAQEAPFSAGGG